MRKVYQSEAPVARHVLEQASQEEIETIAETGELPRRIQLNVLREISFCRENVTLKFVSNNIVALARQIKR